MTSMHLSSCSEVNIDTKVSNFLTCCRHQQSGYPKTEHISAETLPTPKGSWTDRQLKFDVTNPDADKVVRERPLRVVSHYLCLQNVPREWAYTVMKEIQIKKNHPTSRLKLYESCEDARVLIQINLGDKNRQAQYRIYFCPSALINLIAFINKCA